MALPATTALRLARVPHPYGTAAVSPPVIVTLSGSMLKARAHTSAKTVSCP